MTSEFFGLNVDIPEGWSNSSTLLLLGPSEDPLPLPTNAKQQATTNGSIVVHAIDIPEEITAKEYLKQNIEDMQRELKSLHIVSEFEEEFPDKTVTGCICDQEQDFAIRQLVAIVSFGNKAIQFVGSAHRERFTRCEKTFREFVEKTTEKK